MNSEDNILLLACKITSVFKNKIHENIKKHSMRQLQLFQNRILS